MKNIAPPRIVSIFATIISLYLFSSVCAAQIPTKNTAQALMNQQRYTEAYATYMLLLREYPADSDIQLGVARSAAAAGKHTHALIAYQRLTQRFPTNPSLRIELAQTYKALGNMDAASKEASEAQRLDPTIASVEFQDLLKPQSDSSALSVLGRLGAGVIYDSNFLLGPPDQDFIVDDLQIRIRDDDVESEAWGSYLKANLDISYKIQNDKPWWIIADVGAYQKWYFNEDDALTWGRAAMGVYFAQPKFWWNLRVKGENTRTEMDPALSAFGAESTFTYFVSPSVQLITKGEYGYLDDQLNSKRSGTYAWIGEYIRFLLSQGAYEIMLGGRAIHNNAQGRYERDGWELSGQLRCALPWNSAIRFFGTWYKDEYAGAAATWLTSDRTDEKFRVGTVLTHQFSDAWSMDLGFQHIQNNSNTEWLEYDQNVVSMGLVWSF